MDMDTADMVMATDTAMARRSRISATDPFSLGESGMSADLTDKGNGGRGRNCAQNDDDVALFQHLCCLENKEHARIFTASD